ncbi:Aste57867_20448 [Aphanomyces stellatus]|uniref:Aste57867_20448 protein n=1 Tax=Aphanomyces stellatus TaxID=120398 RepID=A0A485LH09_9STRA|nr:hypothetical protein As57867_020382 [Aphanomyces stellatus]VFT97134.1 Aste57867_20448 [Aphanomyces stellatus]
MGQSTSPSLAIDGDEIRAAAKHAVDLGLAHHEAYFTNPPGIRSSSAIRDVDGPWANASLAAAEYDPPTAPAASMDSLLSYVRDNVVGDAAGTNTATPTNLAFVCGGLLPQANALDFYLHSINPYGNVWYMAPFLQRLEVNVIHWFCRVVGYPRPHSLGIFSDGASMANHHAIVLARQKAFPDNHDIARGTMYLSRDAHFCLAKGARMAGIVPEHCRVIETDSQGRMRVDALAAQLEADVAAGLVPFFIATALGTTSLGAVDDLLSIAALAKAFGCHLHCDGAMGGLFLLTDRGKNVMQGVELSDSVCFDFHKSLGLPLATSLLVVKDRNDLVDGFRSANANDYLPQASHASTRYFLGSEAEFDHDLIAFTDCSPELSRAPKGVKVWWMLKLHGFDAWRAHADLLLDCAAYARAELASVRGILLGPSGLEVVTFRVATDPDCSTVDAMNAKTTAFVAAVNQRHKVRMSMAAYTPDKGPKYTLARVCFQHVAVTRAVVDLLVAEVRAVAELSRDQ